MDIIDVDDVSSSIIYLPGQYITDERDYLSCHGTIRVDDVENETSSSKSSRLISVVAGKVERVNRLIYVHPFRHRYMPETGDLVIGRIVEVGPKKWKVDINAHKHAILMLSSINLPDGAQRIRTIEDQLQMRTFFSEGDLIIKISSDGSAMIHTRDENYGKIDNFGTFVSVPSYLIPKQTSEQRFELSLINDVRIQLTIGRNGFIWISSSDKQQCFDMLTRVRQAVNLCKIRDVPVSIEAVSFILQPYLASSSS